MTVTLVPTDQARIDAQLSVVGGGLSRTPAESESSPTSEPPGCDPPPTDHTPNEIQGTPVGGGLSPAAGDVSIPDPRSLPELTAEDQATPRTKPVDAPPDPRPWLILRFYADTYWDLMATRQGLTSRARLSTVSLDHAAPILAAAQHVENEAKKTLKRVFKQTAPDLYRWVGDTRGLGHHTMARLLGIIGDPTYAWPHRWYDTKPEGHTCLPQCGKRHLVALQPHPRRVSDLWSYCGVGDPTRKRRKGMSQDDALGAGSPRARAVLYVISECVMKDLGNVHRPVYDLARERYATRDWTDGHRHAAALRLVAKVILRDLWLAAGKP